MFRLCVELNQLSLKAFSAKIAIVSSNGTLVNKDDTSYDTKISPLLILSSRTSLTKSKMSVTVYRFKDNGLSLLSSHLATPWLLGYTRGHLHARVDGHKSTSSSVRKHYDNDHAGTVPEDLLSCFKVIKKCRTKFDCLVNEMLYIKQLTPSLNVQTDSIRAKVFV